MLDSETGLTSQQRPSLLGVEFDTAKPELGDYLDTSSGMVFGASIQ